MVKRKQPVLQEQVVHDLSDLVEFNIKEVLRDGGKRKATLYLVKVRPISNTHRARKAARTSTAPAASESGLYVLKIFPVITSNREDYRKELAANVELGRVYAPVDPQAACDVLMDPTVDFASDRWPRCFGSLRTGDKPTHGTWIRNEAKTDRNPALLFNYIPDLERLTSEMLTPDLSQEYQKVLAELHAFKVLHRDQLLHAAWPEIEFNNVFLRKNELTGTKEILILDFDKSLVLGDSARDQMLLRDEAQDMQNALKIALSKEKILPTLSKEARRLLQ